MLGWPEGESNTVSYSFPDWNGASAAPFTRWSEAQYLNIADWIPPQLRGCGVLMYPSILDAQSPFSLGGCHDDGDCNGDTSSLGLSYGLIGNASTSLYFVVGRKFIMRLPVAFLPAGAPSPGAGPYASTPSAVNPANCSIFLVAGAGREGVNGIYKKLERGEPRLRSGSDTALYQKDDKHQLCTSPVDAGFNQPHYYPLL